VFSGITSVSALRVTDDSNTDYFSEAYSSESQCSNDVEKYNSLYPSFYRSDCFE
jgi:hypothetical protein